MPGGTLSDCDTWHRYSEMLSPDGPKSAAAASRTKTMMPSVVPVRARKRAADAIITDKKGIQNHEEESVGPRVGGRGLDGRCATELPGGGARRPGTGRRADRAGGNCSVKRAEPRRVLVQHAVTARGFQSPGLRAPASPNLSSLDRGLEPGEQIIVLKPTHVHYEPCRYRESGESGNAGSVPGHRVSVGGSSTDQGVLVAVPVPVLESFGRAPKPVMRLPQLACGTGKCTANGIASARCRSTGTA